MQPRGDVRVYRSGRTDLDLEKRSRAMGAQVDRICFRIAVHAHSDPSTILCTSCATTIGLDKAPRCVWPWPCGH